MAGKRKTRMAKAKHDAKMIRADDQWSGDEFVEMDCAPTELKGRRFYQPTERGLEARIKERLDRFRQPR